MSGKEPVAETPTYELRQSTETQCWRDQFGNVVLLDEWGAKFYPADPRYGVGLNKESMVSLAVGVLAHYGVKAASVVCVSDRDLAGAGVAA
jgi:hypothetical protein